MNAATAAVTELARDLARHGCELKLGWYRDRVVAWRPATARRRAVLHVHQLLALEPAARGHLVDHARSAGRRHPRTLKSLIARLAPAIFAQPPRTDLAGLDAGQRVFYHDLVRRMAARGILVTLNRNQSHVISIREHSFGYRTLSVHRQLLAKPEILPGLQALMAGSRDLDPRLEAAMEALVTEPVEAVSGLEDLPTIGGDFDFRSCYREVHTRWFSDLSLPSFRWARNPGERRSLRSIRFGCYHRDPRPEIRLNPRLDQPWVATAFVEAVLHHELCHHRQAESPVWRERHHSARFRQWEAQYPQHDLVKHWERQNLLRFLKPVERRAAPAKPADDHQPTKAPALIQEPREPIQLDLFGQLDF